MVPFVGRQAELAVLRARLADALSGRPRFVQVQGPAGIGKTALLDQFLGEQQGTSAPFVLAASGEETEELLAYGVAEQLFRAFGSTVAARSTGAVSGTAPALAERRPANGSNPIEDPVTVGTRLLELLDRLGGSPVILAVDDAHWADRPSLQALIFALRRLAADQVLAIIAVRDDRASDLPESLGRLVNGQRGTVLRLRGLDEEDLRDLAAAMGIDGIGATAARRLRYGTQGNPLHARALLEEFPPSVWGPDDRQLPSPLSFRRLVQDRYAACSPPTRSLIDAAAVLGPHCPLPVAAELAGLQNPLPALDEATTSDLLQAAEATTPWTLNFPHPLVRAAVYDALGPVRRHVLHSAAAALVTDEATVLRHRVAAATEPDEELAADLTRFADREGQRQALQSAAAHLVSASRLTSDPVQAQRRVLQAVVWTMLRGDAATAADIAGEISAYPPSPLRDAVLGSLAMAADDPISAEQLLAGAWAGRAAGDDPVAGDSGAGGQEAGGPGAGDPEATAIVALMTAIHWYGRLDARSTVRWCEETLSAVSAASLSATTVHAVAVTYLVHGLGYAGRTAESVAAAEPARERPGDPDHLWLNPRSARGVLHLVDDELDEARSDLESVAVTASKLGILNTAAFSYAYLARAEWVAGDWDDALLHADRAVAINVESDFGFMQSAVIGIAVLVPAGRGDWATAEGYLRMLTENDKGYERSIVALGMARARLGEARGRAGDVIAALDPVRQFGNRDAVDEPGFWPWQDLYADALVGVGRIGHAEAFLPPHEELAQQRGRRTAMARLARARGGLEAAAGRPDQAESAFTRALELTENLPAPFERARVELAAGRFLRRAGQRRRAADLLDAARRRFTELGAAPYAERCATELAASGLNPGVRIGRDRRGLTSQELVVARLAASGCSNREIADELVVSIKTIEYHLRNAFGKLGVSSRRQLPDRLADLVDGPR